MIDFHTHTILSDGELLPSELVRRAAVLGYKGIALTDHVDYSNIDFVVPRLVAACVKLNKRYKNLTIIPGVEITHVPPKDFQELVKYARDNGAQVVLIHGETLAEPVVPGTNNIALDCDIDILAHPGLITYAEAKKAAKRNIYLEITARKGHSLSNGHVAQIARKTGAKLVINTDTHTMDNLITQTEAITICRGAGLTPYEIKQIVNNALTIVRKLFLK